ncbi:hypothetical protein [Mycobacteroides abscessus]|uniref:hypothetical protein n=1 Tax=Mycobacteroides abscessus TaxID=36809 RepID=UPI000C256061|nr:hypothetical protein [Mycobacteroides abscessus]
MFDDYKRRAWQDTDGDISDRQSELATSLRIPILTSEYPSWHYITGIVVNDRASGWPSVMPTDDEIREVGAHLESYCQYYNQGFRNAMKEFAPYDIDGGANLGYYMKRPRGGWSYRKRTWQSGPHWWPADTDTMTLTEVLTHNFTGWFFAEKPGGQRV